MKEIILVRNYFAAYNLTSNLLIQVVQNPTKEVMLTRNLSTAQNVKRILPGQVV